jgi:predicted NACHT family NTPase
MGDELDLNSIVAQFIQQNIEAFIDTAKGIIKMGTDKIRLDLNQTYEDYLTNVIDRYAKAKSFIFRGEPVQLYRFYVPLNIRFQKQIIHSPGINEIQKISRCIVITGSAGCGKSMMMRHLLLNSIVSKNKVPIFIELRQFNSSDTDIRTLIYETLRIHKFNLDKEYIDKAFQIGHFILFLDGYDEVISTKRSHVTKCIQDFSKQYDQNCIIISSRPDIEIEGWPEFTVIKIHPLILDQAYQLIYKLPYDDELKTKFLIDLRSGLFQKHESFLSNPLLLTIMLLTYGQSATIPNKLNVFYNQAYEALFERHDALKGGYRRERLTSFDIQDFGRLFSAFCLLSYDKREFEFSHTQALEYIEKSQPITGLRCSKDAFLQDLIQAVCLLIMDGMQIVYSHRSFQEYFTARFIADARPDIQEQLVKKYAKMSRYDNVLPIEPLAKVL